MAKLWHIIKTAMNKNRLYIVAGLFSFVLCAQALVVGNAEKSKELSACVAEGQSKAKLDKDLAIENCKNFVLDALTERMPDSQELEQRITKLRRTKEARLITQGKGVWVNLWNYPDNTSRFMTRLKSFDIDTIYLQVNRSTTPIFKHPTEKIDEILETAHANDIKVIGWSYCYLNDIPTDIKKFIEPALYVSKNGHKFDGMAADIEENIELSVVKSYTEKIKAALPNDYPILAIVFSPQIKSKYPWKYIGENWDVLMPMTYWHGIKNRWRQGAVDNFVSDTLKDLRRLTGREDLNIHLITDGESTTAREVAASLAAAKKLNVNAGISIYPEHLVSDSVLEVLKNHQNEEEKLAALN